MVPWQAAHKLLWSDELLTYWIGQQRSIPAIWAALRAGADPNPPLMHALSWASTSAFGGAPLSIRLPSMLGMALAVASLWGLLRRYVAPAFACAGCLTFMAMRGFDYAYDARSYALLMGFSAAAVWCWDRGIDAKGMRRFACLTGLTVALAAAISSNYYGAFSFLPVAAGELVLTLGRRKLRPGVPLALLTGALPLLAYLQLMRAGITEFGPHAWNRPSFSMLTETYFVLVEGPLWLLLAGAGLIYWKRRHGAAAPAVFPAPLRAACGTLLVLPFAALAIAWAGSAMISPRCVLEVCFGVALATTGCLASLANRKLAIVAVAVLTVWVGAREGACAYVLRAQRHAFLHLRNEVERAAAPGEPVVLSDSSLALPLCWYGSAALCGEMRYPIDFNAIHRREAEDSGEQNLWSGRQGVFPMKIGPPVEVLPEGEEMLVVARPDGWLPQQLRANGYALETDQAVIAWDALGGVFTPMAHAETRLFFARPIPARPLGAISAGGPVTEVSSKP